MKRRFFVMLSILLSLAFIGTACGPKAEPTPTTDPSAIMTEVAQTVAAEITQEALLTPSPTATLAPSPTIPATPTVAMTSMPSVAATIPAAGVATQPVTTADNSTVLKDVTIPDGTEFYTNESFKKTWKVQNTGATTWDSSYSLVNLDGSTFGADGVIPLTTTVLPGGEVELSISMRSPSNFGEYFSRWKLMNPSGQIFGMEMYVYIVVTEDAKKTATPTG
jgi:hypothetical protein